MPAILPAALRGRLGAGVIGRLVVGRRLLASKQARHCRVTLLADTHRFGYRIAKQCCYPQPVVGQSNPRFTEIVLPVDPPVPQYPKQKGGGYGRNGFPRP